MNAISWFENLGLADVGTVGGKGANLGELTSAGLPVPGGFVVTSEAYLAALDASGARARLREIQQNLDADDDAALNAACAESRSLILATPLPENVAAAITEAYEQLGGKLRVAVRSSGTSEDAGDTSFAGMNETFTNVVGVDDVLTRIVDCWASLYGKRSIAYRANAGMTEEPTIAVIVQTMIPSERAGIMFTADPSTSDTSRIVIEAILGQGEAIVSGMVEPDTYRVNKVPLEILDVRVGRQDRQIIRGSDGADLEVPLSPTDAARQVLSDSEILDIARLGLDVEKHYGSPQDIEWAYADGKMWLVQSRPITTLNGPAAHPTAEADETVLVRGLAASTGRATGVVRVLLSPDEGARLKTGEVLVAPMTSPDWVPAMRRAAALITDGGGMTCHAAIDQPRARRAVCRRHP